MQLWDKALSKTEIENCKINCEFTDWSEWSSCENAAKKGNNIDDNVFAIRRRTRKRINIKWGYQMPNEIIGEKL